MRCRQRRERSLGKKKRWKEGRGGANHYIGRLTARCRYPLAVGRNRTGTGRARGEGAGGQSGHLGTGPEFLAGVHLEGRPGTTGGVWRLCGPAHLNPCIQMGNESRLAGGYRIPKGPMRESCQCAAHAARSASLLIGAMQRQAAAPGKPAKAHTRPIHQNPDNARRRR